jgi:hypothetical protein
MTLTKHKEQPNAFQRLTAFFAPKASVAETISEAEPISELIGRISYRFNNQALRVRPTIDYTETDYEWWDKFRRGKQAGYEIGGLFASPMAQIIASWSLGDGFGIETEDEGLQEAFQEFLKQYLQMLVETKEDDLCLGDAYLIVNADGSIQKISPEQVEITRNELDFNLIERVTVTTINDAIEIEDIYSPTERIVRVKRAGATTEQRFPNLIGRLPIVHFANDRGSNESNGRPYFESLLTLFAEYDDVIRKGLDGVKLMGNPIPVVEGLEDPEGAKRLNATYTETYTDAQGNTQTDYRTELSPTEMYFFGKGATFKFAAPGNFSENTNTMLKKLFYVMLQHAKIPEWVWGGAISSSMASVEAQAPAFVKFIEGQRRKLEQPIRELLEIYFATLSLFTPGIGNENRFTIEWPDLMPEDKELSLKWAMWLKENGIISKETALREADMVKDIEAELKKAEAEKKAEEKQAMRNAMGSEGAMMRRNAIGQQFQNAQTQAVDTNPPPQ